jgi:cyclophilin family peptidyl-prolyl cis-trans isomerase
MSFPKESKERNWYFTIELAPVDDMPHTVYTFLEQVSHHLYDDGGYSFFANAAHVVQGGPQANHLTAKGENPEQRFTDSGYGAVAFPEYSTNFPHERFTLGLSGRPGGPKFYINMLDNSKNHGPGGYAEDGTGDPCFGKITHGFDVVEKMHAASGPLESGQWKDTEGGSIAVRSIKILK